MRILSIYYLEGKGDDFEEFGNALKESTKSDVVLFFENVNQIEGKQYPYLVIQDY